MWCMAGMCEAALQALLDMDDSNRVPLLLISIRQTAKEPGNHCVPKIPVSHLSKRNQCRDFANSSPLFWRGLRLAFFLLNQQTNISGKWNNSCRSESIHSGQAHCKCNYCNQYIIPEVEYRLLGFNTGKHTVTEVKQVQLALFFSSVSSLNHLMLTLESLLFISCLFYVSTISPHLQSLLTQIFFSIHTLSHYSALKLLKHMIMYCSHNGSFQLQAPCPKIKCDILSRHSVKIMIFTYRTPQFSLIL